MSKSTVKTEDRLALANEEAAAKISVSPHTLANWRSLGIGPPYVKITPGRAGRVLYRVADLEAWLEANLVGGGADE